MKQANLFAIKMTGNPKVMGKTRRYALRDVADDMYHCA